MASYAIGDVQGCYTSLMQLLDQIRFSDSDTLWFAGDLVNRGPESLEALRFIHQLGDSARVVLGNHDLHLLAAAHGHSRLKKGDTLRCILTASDRDTLLNWLIRQPLLVEDTQLGYVMTHAGIPPNWSLKTARKLAAEVEACLQSPQANDFFAHMYGNQPDIWEDSLSGYARLRVITNYLTRMRFCTAQGQLDFAAKGGLDSQPEGMRPWFEHPIKRKAAIIFGHWAALEGQAEPANIFALDTGCVWGGALTALRLEDRARFSTPCPSR